ncbi:hypothetical protein [Rhodococcus marinonascens]|nr:hypothetical protein [Rhodococcus marinonascens]
MADLDSHPAQASTVFLCEPLAVLRLEDPGSSEDCGINTQRLSRTERN